jgi:hypothetical protein
LEKWFMSGRFWLEGCKATASDKQQLGDISGEDE